MNEDSQQEPETFVVAPGQAPPPPDIYSRFEDWMWKRCRACRIGRGCLALGSVLFPAINIAALAFVIYLLIGLLNQAAEVACQ